MNIFARILSWIDRGYDDAARSNYAMGVIINVAGIAALSIQDPVAKFLLLGVAALTALVFGWRMLLYFGRLIKASDRRRMRKR